MTLIDGQSLGRLLKRHDFLAVSKGRRFHGTAFGLQYRKTQTDPHPVARIGFTVTRKVGTSVERNRIRRRLREVVRQVPSTAWQVDCDYVFVAKRDALSVPFALLVDSVRVALSHIHTSDGHRRQR